MRLVYIVAIGAIAAAAAFGELVLDIRTPVSSLKQAHALGASVQLSLDPYHQKMEQMRALHGQRVNVSLETSTGHMSVELDGKIIEEGHINRQFAGMYGMFVVNTGADAASIFPFALDPGSIPAARDHEPNVGRLQGHFESTLPARYLSFSDNDWTRDSCTAPSTPEMGFRRLAKRLRLRSETACVIRWNGTNPGSMLVAVTLADGDPWMRPFALRICRPIVEAALARLADRGLPTYAACVLVDRPERTGQTGTQDAFTSVVYEVRGRGLARID
jgi:hypothetical protein